MLGLLEPSMAALMNPGRCFRHLKHAHHRSLTQHLWYVHAVLIELFARTHKADAEQESGLQRYAWVICISCLSYKTHDVRMRLGAYTVANFNRSKG